MAEIHFEQFEELELPAHATAEEQMHHQNAESELEEKHPKSQQLLRRLVMILVVVILVGFGTFFLYRYLYAQSQDPNSRIGALWVDIHTQPDSDPDQDGLSNAEESKYATNFWEKDSDGDGFSDGDEVKHGYNPNGSGKLTDIKFDFNSLGQ